MTTQTTTRFLRISAMAAAAAVCLLLSYRETAMGGIQGSGFRRVMAIGRITAFGSIFVNGVEYSTAHAQMNVNDQPGTESQLRVGQIVTLNGSLNDDGRTGEATEVSFFGDVQGPVRQLDLVGGTFEVLGQVVQVSDDTLFDATLQPLGLQALRNGTIVEVSGFANVAGDLIASRIDMNPLDDNLQVKGIVSALDTTMRSFRINTLTVDYSEIAPEGELVEGAVVKVHGTTASTPYLLRATHLQVLPPAAGAANEHGDVQGIISSFDSQAKFAINGQRVATNSNTHFVLHGQELGVDLALDVKGIFDASGVLVANKVFAKASKSTVVRGVVEAIADSSLTVRGAAVGIMATTIFEDRSALKLRTFGLNDLRVGDAVEIRGVRNPIDRELRASLVARTENPVANAPLHSHGKGRSTTAPPPQ